MVAPPRPLVAVDTNVLMDLGEELEAVMDAFQTIRARVPSLRLVIPPTPQQELALIARAGDSAPERKRARGGIATARRWRIVPINLMPVEHGIVGCIGARLREARLLSRPRRKSCGSSSRIEAVDSSEAQLGPAFG